jgi:hypothetical protein
MASRPRKNRLTFAGVANTMSDPIRSAAGRDRRLLLAAIAVLGLAVAGLAYVYSDDLTALVSGKLGHAQSRSLRY